MKVLADASLPALDALFSPQFTVTRYATEETLKKALSTHDILIARSTLRITPTLLQGTQLKCIATASSGSDHVDKAYLKQQNIAFFDAKGSNAIAVTDYVTACLAYLKHEEKLPGKRVGVIGAGAVGSLVIKRLTQLGFDVIAYDPLKPGFNTCTLRALQTVDILCIHANLHETAPHPSKGLLGARFLSALKPNTVLINAARGGIVDEAALLACPQSITYCTDVYQHEPKINPRIIQTATLCTPHIAGHSIEAKYQAVSQLSQKIHTHFGLTPPKVSPPTIAATPNKTLTWDTYALHAYNPYLETQALKSSTDLTQTFLTLRRAHQHRHDFHWRS